MEYLKKEDFNKKKFDNSFRTFFEINGKEVEILRNIDDSYRDPKSLNRKVYIEKDGVKFPCISLLDELKTYRKIGRIDKIEIIENFLSIQR